MHRKKLLLWSLYNSGAAAVEVVFILYFSQWLVVDRGLPDFWFNGALIGASILLLFCTPLAAAWGDVGGKRRLGLTLGTLGSALCFIAVALIAMLAPVYAELSAVLFMCGLAFFLFAGIFWCALLPDVAEAENFGVASGWGQFADWTGEIVALLATLPFAVGALVLFGMPGRTQTLLPATLLFLLFTAPLLLFLRKTKTTTAPRISSWGYKTAIRDFVHLARAGGLGWFFIAFFFFNDAVITAANNFPIYLERVFGVPDTIKAALVVVILVSAAVGALVGGFLTDRYSARSVLLWNLAGWLLILPSMAATMYFPLFVVEVVFMGLWFGSVWVVARTLVAHRAPKASLNRAFSYYILMERFATLVGPLSWSIIVATIPSGAGGNYRIALLSMTVFVALGLFLARKIPASTPTASLVS